MKYQSKRQHVQRQTRRIGYVQTQRQPLQAPQYRRLAGLCGRMSRVAR